MNRFSARDDSFAPTQAPESSIGGGRPHVPQDSVVRIVRVSPARVQGSAMDELFAARKRVSGSGGIPGLCGAVLHVCGWFVLWQEGPESAVEAALKASARRRRHETPRVLHRSVGSRTLVEPLALSTTQWPERPELFAQRIESLEQAGPTLRPQDLWRAFSEPCTLASSSQWPPRQRRVGLLASDDPRSVEIARRLADRFRRPVVYRRFAGADPGTSDVGASYLDLPTPQSALRLHAVSRRALAHPLVHQSVLGTERIALLVGEQPLKAMELAAGVAAFLQRSGTRPQIELLAESDAVASSVEQFLREHASAPVSRRQATATESQLLDFLAGEPLPAP